MCSTVPRDAGDTVMALSTYQRLALSNNAVLTPSAYQRHVLTVPRERWECRLHGRNVPVWSLGLLGEVGVAVQEGCVSPAKEVLGFKGGP